MQKSKRTRIIVQTADYPKRVTPGPVVYYSPVCRVDQLGLILAMGENWYKAASGAE